jgi:hypothetical protein
MELSKIADGKLQEAFDYALDEAQASVHDSWSKRNKDGIATAKITITVMVDGMLDSDTEALDWGVKVACPARVSPGGPIIEVQQELPGLEHHAGLTGLAAREAQR